MRMIFVLALGAAALLLFRRKPAGGGWTFDVDDLGLVSLSPEGVPVRLDPDTMRAWISLVEAWPDVLNVKDSYRPAGGAKKSQHRQGHALDVQIPAAYRAGKSGSIEWRRRFIGAAQRAGFSAFGLGYGTIHIDTGPARWWTYDQGADVGYPGKLDEKYADRVPAEFRAGGQSVPDLSGVV
jgi:hypothetical protein